MSTQHSYERRLGRYVVHDRIASGGMAAVHVGRLVGPARFARTVAIKRLHPALAEDQDAVGMLFNEARLAARLHHPNVAPTLDVVVQRGDAYVIMDYVHGESLARLLRVASREGPPAARIITSIVSGALRGLHAAHEARNERGEPLEIVHRDVSPQNILVGVDGVARLIDFGIAKARMRAQTTAEGRLRGKLSYLAPEQIRGEGATRRADIYSAGIVLWEALTGRRLYDGDCAGAITEQILVGWVDPPSKHAPELSEALDSVTLRALATEPRRRFTTAEEMAIALERAEPPACAAEVGAWVAATAADTLRERDKLLRAIEASEHPPRLRSRASWARRALIAAFAVVPLSAATAGFRPRPSTIAPPSIPPAPRPIDLLRSTAGRVEGRPGPNDTSPLAEGVLRAVPERLRNLETSLDGPSQPSQRKDRTLVPQRAAQPREAARAQSGSCDPPYNINSDGIRIYKRRCLR